MALYADSHYPVSQAVDALHADEMKSFSKTGTWGSAEQRTAVAAIARKARCEAGLHESVGDEALCDTVELPAAVRRLAVAVALGGQEIDLEFCRQAQSEGVTEGAYVEIVAVVSRLVNLDVFARGIGVPSRPLSAPADNTKPSFERPSEAIDEGFYTASVPCAPAGGALAKSLYGDGPVGNILRAVSLVPSEAHRVISLIKQQYFPAEKLLDFSSESDHALSRAQIELVATKVSEHNQCFY